MTSSSRRRSAAGSAPSKPLSLRSADRTRETALRATAAVMPGSGGPESLWAALGRR
jgi:hypothetical protein